MKIMKRYIVNLVFYSIVSLWIFSSCEDYDSRIFLIRDSGRYDPGFEVITG